MTGGPLRWHDMNARIFLFGISIFSLSACSSLNSLLSYEEDTPAGAATLPEAPPPAAPQTAANEWCQRVAASDRLRAQQAGFDAATLDRMTLQSLRQCAAMGAR